MDDTNEKLARILDRTGDYRIARRVPAPVIGTITDEGRRRAGLATGIVLDTETTGLGPDDEVIELAMVRFAFDPATNRIDHVVDTFAALQEPSRPIPPVVTRLTGLAAGDVAGHAIDADAVAAAVDSAAVVVAHNSAFDRPACERTWPVFARAPWACSLREVNWRAEGFESVKLKHLLLERQLFFDGHRALDDCLALLHLLGLPLLLGKTGFESMMENAALVGVRLWAVGAPYDRKDALKSRGYRWCDGTSGAPRSWSTEIPEAAVDDEVAFLRESIYRDSAAAPLCARVTAWERYSVRADLPQR